MLEWLKRHAWKACILQKSIGGSNPPLSAKHLKLSAQRWAFSVQGRQELAPVRTCTEKAQGRKAMSFKCFARAPAASGRGKVTLCVANPAGSVEGACKGAQRLRKSPRRAEREKASAELQNTLLRNLSEDDYYKPSHKGLQSICESTILGKDIISSLESTTLPMPLTVLQ